MNSLKANILFNLIGGGIILIVVGYIAMSHFTSQAVPLCSGRYHNGFQMGYADHAGRLLSPIELSARSSARQWGFSGNASAVSIKGEPFNNALKVKLDSVDSDDDVPRNGVGFIWRPFEIARATSACLSYSVFIPQNFSFPESGYFPGFFGAPDLNKIDESPADDSFTLRVAWQPSGDVGVEVRTPGGRGYVEGASRRTVWPKGRWVPVEEEIRLNAEKKADGVVRLWVDGNLVIDRGGIKFNDNPRSAITGVLAEIGYGRMQGASTVLGVSPIVLRW